jgi:hypothetical protein
VAIADRDAARGDEGAGMIVLVWSFEHDGWWCQASGYCNNVDKARRFGLAEAVNIVTRANSVTGWINEAIAVFDDETAIARLKSGRPQFASRPGPHGWREE